MLVNFQALGCRLNEAEIETWASQFMQRGHEVTTDAAEADIVVFNSCAVTAEAERKSRQQIGRLQRANPAARLIVSGCHASLDPAAVSARLGVDLVVENADKDDLVPRTLALFGSAAQTPASAEPGLGEALNSLLLRGRHRGFVKIQDGCRYRCTYCIVTLARGDERSRAEAEILAEINRLHRQGVREIALTGVHVGGYGSDTGSSLYRLLSEILEHSDIPRIRLASVEPWDLPKNFFELFRDPRLMPHMHLPIQSGCDSVLRRMARRCKTAEFARLVDTAHEAVPLFNITTDLIVGFPGETEQEWRRTMDFVERTGFGHMHIFPFSPRAGTRAARLPDQVDALTRKARSRELHELAARLKRDALLQHSGRSAEVLWEQETSPGSGQWCGYTPHYHRITGWRAGGAAADIRRVRIDAVSADGATLIAAGEQPQVGVAEIGMA